MSGYCVYLHTAIEDFSMNGVNYEKGDILYVGSGRKTRITDKTGRSAKHLEIWDKLEKYAIHENLNHEEKFIIEQEEILKYFDSGKLLNSKRTVNKPHKIVFSEISEYFYIDSSSPSYLRWAKDKSTKKKGQSAGYLTKLGYWTVGYNGKAYHAHRIIWALQNKTDCPMHLVIDHIDGTKYDVIGKSNNPLNLRAVEHGVNNRNRRVGKSNKSGVLGVSWIKADKAWLAQMKIGSLYIRQYFTPNKLFPGEPFEEAKEKSKKLAEQYRKELELCYNSTPSQ